MSLDCLGANVEIGFDFGEGLGTIFQAAGGLTTGITSMVEKEQEKKKLEGEEKKNLETAKTADLAAATALAKAAISAKLKSASAAIDKTAADTALSAQDRAASKLSPAGNEERAAAADKARANAISQAQSSPNDGYKAALVDAWTTIINKANSAAIVDKGKSGGELVKHESGGDSWLTKKVIGPVPGWGVAVGGAGIAALLAKKVFHIF